MKLVQAFNNGKERHYQANQIILYQGEKSYDVFRVVEGFIKVYDIDTQGNEKVVLVLGKGNIFPILPAMDSKNNDRYFYETLTKTNLETISRTVFRNRISKDSEFSLSVLSYFTHLIDDLFARIACIEATNSKHKVAQVLAYLVQHHGGTKKNNLRTIRVPVTHQLIADMAGIVRETASLQLKELENEQIVRKASEHRFHVYEQKLLRFIETDN